MTNSGEASAGVFQPLHAGHAIQEAIFFFSFGRSFTPPELESTVSLQEAFKESLPAFERVDVYQIKLNEPGSPPEASGLGLGGVVFQKRDVDGNLVRMVRIAQNIVGVHFVVYSRWDKVWPEARGLLKACVERLNIQDNPITGVSLRYIDNFSFVGLPDAYSAESLFQRGSQYLTSKNFSSGHLWHNHSGWYDKCPSGRNVLNQLNVGTGIVVDQHQTLIDHCISTDVGRLTISDDLFGQEPSSEALLDVLMGYMHAGNRAVLLDLLTPSMAQRINLERRSK